MHVLLKYQSFDIIDKLVNCFDVLRYVLDVCHLIRRYALGTERGSQDQSPW